MTKQCRRCGIFKLPDAYCKGRTSDGLSSWCRACATAAVRASSRLKRSLLCDAHVQAARSAAKAERKAAETRQCRKCGTAHLRTAFAEKGLVCRSCKDAQRARSEANEAAALRARYERQREERAAARAALPPPPPYVPPTEKACTKCEAVKPLLDFGKGQCRDGRNSWCQACCTAGSSAHRAHRRATDPEFREALAAQKRAERRATDPTLTERDARRADCTAHVAAYAAWRETLRKPNAHVAAYRAHLKALPPTPVAPLPHSYEGCFARAYERCRSSMRRARRKGRRVPGIGVPQLLVYYLRAVQLERRTGLDWDVDHITPYAEGGWHWQGNLQILPREMNALKGARGGTIPIGVPTPEELENAWTL